ncbi:hypothetical protein [Streptomyces chattanoogensis]|nr:hypothetical protein [Streptomyces chattanoogensis]
MNVELALKEHEDVFDLDVREVGDAAAPVDQEAAFTIGVRCETLSIGC